MNDPLDASASNPFSSRHVRPGAVPYQFPEGVDSQMLVRRLRSNSWRGQIVGPHGSGKSALLAVLVPAIEAAGRRVAMVELHDGQRRPPDGFPPGEGDRRTVLVVDGYEQLSLASRIGIGLKCRRRGMGLLVTTHRRHRLPELFHTRPDVELAQQIVDRLLGRHRRLISREEVAEAFVTQRGDLREMLFALYDLYERRRRS